MDADTSDDEARPKESQNESELPVNKPKAKNAFSSDEDTDDEESELATLSGSQSLNLTDSSQISPGIATQPSSIEKPVKAEAEIGFVFSRAIKGPSRPKQQNPRSEAAKTKAKRTRHRKDQENRSPSKDLTVKSLHFAEKLDLKPIGDGNSRTESEAHVKELLGNKSNKRPKNEVEPLKTKASRKQKEVDVIEIHDDDSMNGSVPDSSGKEIQESHEETKLSKPSRTSKSDPVSEIIISDEQHSPEVQANVTERKEAAKLKAVYAKATKTSTSPVIVKTNRSPPNKVNHPVSTPAKETVVASVPLQHCESDIAASDIQQANQEHETNTRQADCKTSKKRSAAPVKEMSGPIDSKGGGDESLAKQKSASKDKPTKQPPKKKKPKKMSFQDQVVNRLFWSFKPFTLRTLSEDLKTAETSIEFCLLSLIDKGLVVKKDFTSSKGRVKTLYWANHDVKSKEVNVGMESNIEDREKTKQTLQTLQTDISMLKTELSQVLLQPSNSDLSDQVSNSESELSLVQQKLDELKSRIEAQSSMKDKISKKRSLGAVALADSSPRSLKRRINHMRDEWKSRKSKCKIFLDLLADGLEKKPKDVVKLLEIDTDEMNNATLPSKHYV